jgi:hypothetical protein
MNKSLIPTLAAWAIFWVVIIIAMIYLPTLADSATSNSVGIVNLATGRTITPTYGWIRASYPPHVVRTTDLYQTLLPADEITLCGRCVGGGGNASVRWFDVSDGAAKTVRVYHHLLVTVQKGAYVITTGLVGRVAGVPAQGRIDAQQILLIQG